MYACCEEIPMRVKAENLRFDHESGIISGSGSVEIHYEDVIIYSDAARIDTKANIATAEGNVRIKQKDYQLSSSVLTYDISTETAVAFKIKTVFYPTDIRANLYFSALKITDLPDVKMGEYGSLTTCDLDEPHYHAESRWFDYYPDDKVVGYLSTLYAGPVPVLWAPYYVYSLKKKKSPYNFIYGENEVEGKFLKTSYDYFFNNSAYGTFLFDTTEIKGPGYGVQHEYVLNQENYGTFYLYKMDEQDTYIKDYVTRITHNVRTDQYSKLTLSHNTSYIYQVPSGRRLDNDSSVNYSRDTGLHKLSYNYNVSNNMITFQNSEAFNINNRYGATIRDLSGTPRKSLRDKRWRAHPTGFITNNPCSRMTPGFPSMPCIQAMSQGNIMQPMKSWNQG